MNDRPSDPTADARQHRRAGCRLAARSRAAAGVVDDSVGAALAGARVARRRDRHFPHRLMGRLVAVAAADGPRDRAVRPGRPARGRAPCRCSASACRARSTACAGSIAAAGSRIGRRQRSPTSSRPASSDQVSLALWRAHVERALRAANALKAGTPRPRLLSVRPDRGARAGPAARVRDVLRRLRRARASASPRRSTGPAWCRPKNYRVDAWVTPPAYTGKPPVILPGVRAGEPHQAAR